MASTTASIDDVARLAGVSTATVSRVLNRPEKVADATAERVRQAMASLDYRPNMFASGLMTRASRVLGLVLPDGFAGVRLEMLRGAEGEASRLGYHLLLTTEARMSDAEAVRDAPALGILDAVGLMVETPSPRLLERAASLDIPVFSIAETGRAWNTPEAGVALVDLLARRVLRSG